MVKLYCDRCGAECTTANARSAMTDVEEPFVVRGVLAVRMMTGKVDARTGLITWNSGEFCDKCIVEAITSQVAPAFAADSERPEL